MFEKLKYKIAEKSVEKSCPSFASFTFLLIIIALFLRKFFYEDGFFCSTAYRTK